MENLTQRSREAEKQSEDYIFICMDENEISSVILDAAITVHNELGGPGLLEAYYESALKHELQLRGLRVETQKHVPVIYKSKEIGEPLINVWQRGANHMPQ